MNEKSTSEVQLYNALGFSANDLAEQMSRCFADYIIPIQFSPSMVATLLRSDSIDLEATVTAAEGDQMVGIAVVCRRGGTARIGGMAVLDTHRGQGLGTKMVRRVIAEAKERGDQRLILEVIEHNTRAAALYDRLGFRRMHRLIAGTIPADTRAPIFPLSASDNVRLAVVLAARGTDAASWELSPAAAFQYTPPTEVFENEGLHVAVHPLEENILLCRAIALSGAQDDRKMRELLCGFNHRFPSRDVKIPPYFPEPAFRALFASLGVRVSRLAQIQMEYRYEWITDQI